MSDVLRSRDELRACSQARIRPTGIERLDILPAGPKPADPAELLSQPRFADLIGWAETQYDYVLVDCPPALIGGDATIVGRMIDNMLLLVQPAKNHRRAVVRAAESLLGLQVRITGVVVNNVTDEGGDEYYGYGAYGYGHAETADGDFPDDAADNINSPETSSSKTARAA